MGTLSVLAVPELLRLHGPTAPAGLPAGQTKHVLPAAVIPVGRKVAETIPQLADAAGGEMLLIASADKGTVDKPSVISGTWAAGLLLVDARGLVTIRAVRRADSPPGRWWTVSSSASRASGRPRNERV